MLHEDLNAFIDEREANLLFKGEFKSCNRAAYYLTNELNDLYTELNQSLDLTTDYLKNVELLNLKMDLIEVYKDIKAIEQDQLLLLNEYTTEELDLIKEHLEGEDLEDFEYHQNFDVEQAKADLRNEKLCCENYLYIMAMEKQIALYQQFCLSLEELLQNIITLRTTDQENLTFNIENKFKSLKEFSLKRDI
jgi:hypothetical protein